MEEIGNEELEEFGELGPEELQLLQQISDNLAAIANEVRAFANEIGTPVRDEELPIRILGRKTAETFGR